MDERTSGHAPASPESTLKYGRAAACAAAAVSKAKLTSKRIPKPHLEVGESGARADQVPTVECVERDICRFGQQRPCQLQARTDFHEIRPCLPLLVESQVGVPVELRPKRLQIGR